MPSLTPRGSLDPCGIGGVSHRGGQVGVCPGESVLGVNSGISFDGVADRIDISGSCRQVVLPGFADCALASAAGCHAGATLPGPSCYQAGRGSAAALAVRTSLGADEWEWDAELAESLQETSVPSVETPFANLSADLLP